MMMVMVVVPSVHHLTLCSVSRPNDGFLGNCINVTGRRRVVCRINSYLPGSGNAAAVAVPLIELQCSCVRADSDPSRRRHPLR